MQKSRCLCVFVQICVYLYPFFDLLFWICFSASQLHGKNQRSFNQQRTILELLFDKVDDILCLCSGEFPRRNTIYFSSLFLMFSNSWCKLGWIIGHSIFFLRIMISAKVILELWFFLVKYPSWVDQRSILFLELFQLNLLTEFLSLQGIFRKNWLVYTSQTNNLENVDYFYFFSGLLQNFTQVFLIYKLLIHGVKVIFICPLKVMWS